MYIIRTKEHTYLAEEVALHEGYASARNARLVANERSTKLAKDPHEILSVLVRSLVLPKVFMYGNFHVEMYNDNQIQVREPTLDPLA